MKERTKAAMSWLDSQIEKAKHNGNQMTTIYLNPKGRLSVDTVAEHFRKAKFETRCGEDVVYVTPYGKTA